MKFGNENGDDCETSIVSLPAYIVISLAGWSLNEEIVELDGNAPVRLELRRNLCVDVAVGPDHEIDRVDLGLGRNRPRSGTLRKGIAATEQRSTCSGSQEVAAPDPAASVKFRIHVEPPILFCRQTLLRRTMRCQPPADQRRANYGYQRKTPVPSGKPDAGFEPSHGSHRHGTLDTSRTVAGRHGGTDRSDRGRGTSGIGADRHSQTRRHGHRGAGAGASFARRAAHLGAGRARHQPAHVRDAVCPRRECRASCRISRREPKCRRTA